MLILISALVKDMFLTFVLFCGVSVSVHVHVEEEGRGRSSKKGR